MKEMCAMQRCFCNSSFQSILCQKTQSQTQTRLQIPTTSAITNQAFFSSSDDFLPRKRWQTFGPSITSTETQRASNFLCRSAHDLSQPWPIRAFDEWLAIASFIDDLSVTTAGSFIIPTREMNVREKNYVYVHTTNQERKLDHDCVYWKSDKDYICHNAIEIEKKKNEEENKRMS